MMMRHIILVSLAMAACATLLPTKVNAASLTVTPIGTLRKQPNDSITFTFSFNPAPENGVLQSLNFRYDNSELSFVPGQNIVDFITTSPTISPTETIVQLSNTQNIVNLTFNVLQPRKDGKSDLFEAFATYVNQIPNSNSQVRTTLIANGSFDVEPVAEPVPEPVTMLGAATALGYGAILKRKSSKKTVS
jgi:hypothetical protein